MQGPWHNSQKEKNDYLYNGKEYNTDLGLNWSDYGARFYDPQIARWTSVDPLAEKYLGWSPYNYVLGNPVKYIDPGGKRVFIRGKLSNALTDLARIATTSRGSTKLRALIDANHMNFTIDNFFWTSDAKYDAFGKLGRINTMYYPNSVWVPIPNTPIV